MQTVTVMSRIGRQTQEETSGIAATGNGKLNISSGPVDARAVVVFVCIKGETQHK